MDYRIRRARPDEHALLPAIERSAAKLFEAAGLPDLTAGEPSDIEFIDAVARGGAVFVAALATNDVPVGFELVAFLDRAAHVYELSVAEGHGRRGLGGQLTDEACRLARHEGFNAVTLSTFLDVPWNAPFYERLGFRHIDRRDWTPGFFLVRDHEVEAGLPVERRGFMRKDLA